MPCGACLCINTAECLVEVRDIATKCLCLKSCRNITLLELFKEDCQEEKMLAAGLDMRQKNTSKLPACISLGRRTYEKD